MTGFDIVDRYDIAISMATGALMGGALVHGVALWVLVLMMFVCCLIVVIRHFDQI